MAAEANGPQFIVRPVKEEALGHFAPAAPFTMNVGVLRGWSQGAAPVAWFHCAIEVIVWMVGWGKVGKWRQASI